MATILITGGTGLVGTALSASLISQKHRVIVLTRSRRGSANGIEYAQWDIDKNEIDANAIQDSDVLIHLAGAGVADARWTRARKKEIRDSRVKSAQFLVSALKKFPNAIHTVISASAIGWYGNDHRKSPVPFSENDQPAAGFLGETCRLWEESIQPVRELGKRLVIFRTGIVLSRKGGAFPQFKKPLHFGMATILGSGKQIISWIHMNDLCRLYCQAVENRELAGVYNAVAPEPCSNKRFMLELAKLEKGKNFLAIHVPSFVLRLILGEMSIEILKSTTVSSRKINQTGFQFQFPTLQAALNALSGEP
ncbi:MAG TPA: TIGR01777 family oxidoreductase [Flavitalea sp.]|nr:TIGR01777 family oxidoreductase [Flavitalea sp.]